MFSSQDAEVLKRKGVFPYDWFDSYERLLHTELPPHSVFTSILNNNKNISKSDYDYAKSVYDRFCKSFKDYHDLYMKTDVLLLADVMEQFREDSYKSFGLDPMHYVTSASFGWDCLLKFSKVELELLSDIDMYMFFENGKRGGYSNCHKNYSKANHKYLPDYDPDKPSVFIMYWDINSQYATVMCNPLPVSDFEWLTPDELKDIFELCKQGRHHEIQPCALSVNLRHNPENRDIEKIFTMCPDIFEDKLCHTLYDKINHILHHRALKYYLDKGMIPLGVNSGVKFKESPWIKSYIEFCVEKRKEAAANNIESLVQFWKDMMNQPYGKTMEDVRKHIDFKLVNNRKDLKKLVHSPLYQGDITYVNNGGDDILLGVSMQKKKVKLDKPIYTGQPILDDSKILMYKFIYDYCLKKWPGKFKVLQTDTDSVVCEVYTDDLPKDIKDDIPKWFDTSEMKRTEFGDTVFPKVNRKVLGMLKDEFHGQFVTEFVGEGPKSYTLRYLKMDGTVDDKSVLKGIPKCSHPSFDDRRDLILNGQANKKITKMCARITSKSHCVRTEVNEKVAIKKELRKRVRDRDSEFETVPYGYYD